MQSDLRAVLEQLTDENDERPIELINDKGEKATFSQMMLIPLTAPSEEYEDEVVEHHFALLQPLDEAGEETGDRVVFDFIVDENGEVKIELVDDPYAIRNIMLIYRGRGKQLKLEDEASDEECESIFGGTLSESDPEYKSEEEDLTEQREQELQDFVNPHKNKKRKKKGFFKKLFGK